MGAWGLEDGRGDDERACRGVINVYRHAHFPKHSAFVSCGGLYAHPQPLAQQGRPEVSALRTAQPKAPRRPAHAGQAAASPFPCGLCCARCIAAAAAVSKRRLPRFRGASGFEFEAAVRLVHVRGQILGLSRCHDAGLEEHVTWWPSLLATQLLQPACRPSAAHPAHLNGGANAATQEGTEFCGKSFTAAPPW